MAEKAANPDLGAAEAIGVALTADAAMQTRKEFRLATMLIGIIVLLIVALVLLVRFRTAHGYAWDEAAWLVLWQLRLPLDDLHLLGVQAHPVHALRRADA